MLGRARWLKPKSNGPTPPGILCEQFQRVLFDRNRTTASASDRVAEGEVRVMGPKSRLLQTLVANGGAGGVPAEGLKWRATPDDEHYVYAIAL